MAASRTEDASHFDRYRLPVGLGVLVVGALVLLFARETVLDDATSGETALQKPPMPRLKVQIVEDELIEQDGVNLAASLDLAASAPEGATAAQNE